MKLDIILTKISTKDEVLRRPFDKCTQIGYLKYISVAILNYLLHTFTKRAIRNITIIDILSTNQIT